MKKIIFVLAVIMMGFLPGVKVFAQDQVEYMTWNETQNKLVEAECTTTYTELNADITVDNPTWNSGWYVLTNNISANKRITVSGEVHLILCDGKTLTASKGITVADDNRYPENPVTNKLIIYGQSGGTGQLVAENSDANSAAIGGGGTTGNCGTITINGGNVSATSLRTGLGIEDDANFYGAGIGGGKGGSGGTITINGGKVTAISNISGSEAISYGAGIGGGFKGDAGKITINGGVVEATANVGGGYNRSYGAGIGGGGSREGYSIEEGSNGEIIINGGSVTATATATGLSVCSYGSGIGGGAYGAGCIITINGGIIAATATANSSGGYNHSSAESDGAGIGSGFQGKGGQITINGGVVTATATASGYEEGYVISKGVGIGDGYDSSGTVTLTIGAGVKLLGGDAADSTTEITKDPNDEVSAEKRKKYMKAIEGIYYKTWDEESKTTIATTTPIYDYTPVTPSTEAIAWSAGTYVVNTDVTITGDVTLTADTNLILCDEAKLTVSGQIRGDYNKNLNIYAGSTSNTVNGTGVLDARNDSQAISIKGSCSINIYGGKINAAPLVSGTAIGTIQGDINIYGGEVTAIGKGDGSVGMFAYRGTINIAGGIIIATGGYCEPGLIADSLTISGGDVIATGGEGYKSSDVYTTAGGNGIEGIVTITAGTPTILAIGGEGKRSGDNITPSQGIKGEISITPESIKVYKGETKDGSWTLATLNNNKTDAQFVKIDKYYTVVFNNNEGSGTMNPQYCEVGGNITLSANTFTRTDYTFNGWNTKADGSGQSYADKAPITLSESIVDGSGQLELFAQWKKNSSGGGGDTPVTPSPVTPATPDPSPTYTPVSDPTSPAYGKTPAEAPKTETIGDKTITTTKYTDGSIGVKTEEKTADGKEIVSEKITEQNGSWMQKTVETAQDGSKVEKHETSDKTGDNTTSKIVKTDAAGKVTETETSSKSTDANKIVTETHSIVNSEGSTNETTITNPNEDYTKVTEVKDPNGNLIEKAESSRTTAEDNTVTYTLSTLDENKNTVEATQTMKDGVGTLQIKETMDGKETSTSYAINGDETSLTELKTTEASVTINDFVQGLDGKTYPVTSIAKGAMQGNQSIEKVSLGANIRRICANAFKDAKNLKELILGGMNLTMAKGLDEGTSKIVLEKNCLKGTSKKLKIYVQNKADKKAVQKQLGKAGNRKAKVKVQK